MRSILFFIINLYIYIVFPLDINGDYLLFIFYFFTRLVLCFSDDFWFYNGCALALQDRIR